MIIDDFEDGRLHSLNHAQHVELAWSYLCRLPPAEARARFATTLRRFAASIGKADLYKEGLTLAWFDAIERRMGAWADYETFAAANPELYDRGFVRG